MREVLQRLLQTIRFERDAFVWMDFNDRATGDALVFVLVTQLLLLLGAGASLFGLVLSLTALIQSLLFALVQWLLYAGIVYAAVRYLFQGEGGFAIYLRIAGFAYPTLLVLIFTSRVIPSEILAFILGYAWYLTIVAFGTHYISDLDMAKSAAASVLGIVGSVIVFSIFSGGILF